MPRTTPPPFPPHDEPDDPLVEGAMRVKPGKRPGSEVYEIEYDDPAPSRRQTLPVPAPDGPVPADKVPTRPTGGALGDPETVRPPLRALERVATSSGLGFGVPGPSFGGDTDFDPRDDDSATPLRRTSSFEKELPPRREIPLSDPPTGFDLSLDDAPGPGFDVPDNEALDLVGRHVKDSLAPAEPSHRADPVSELRERYALGDFSGALTIAEAVLTEDPQNTDAQRYAESCRDVLKQMYAARLGPLDQVAVVAVPAEQLRWLTLDHRSGFLLSHVDGVSTLEEILDISGMPHLEAMRIICDLVQQKVIALQ